MNLIDFGKREIDIAIKILELYKDGLVSYLASRVLISDQEKDFDIQFNPSTGMVYLTDNDLNVIVPNSDGDKLVLWISCPHCGHEGSEKDWDHEYRDGLLPKECCVSHYRELLGFKDEFEARSASSWQK